MAHSFRHTPIFGNCTYGRSEMKWWKRYSNHAMRRRTKQRLRSWERWEEIDLPRKSKELVDEWSLPPDGKFYWKNCPPKEMRK